MHIVWNVMIMELQVLILHNWEIKHIKDINKNAESQTYIRIFYWFYILRMPIIHFGFSLISCKKPQHYMVGGIFKNFKTKYIQWWHTGMCKSFAFSLVARPKLIWGGVDVIVIFVTHCTWNQLHVLQV